MTLAVGAGILLVGMLIGRVARLRRRPARPVPVCGCGHHYAMHEPGVGRCHAKIMEKTYVSGSTTETLEQCTCQVYTGPAPVEVLWRDGVAMLPPSSG